MAGPREVPRGIQHAADCSVEPAESAAFVEPEPGLLGVHRAIQPAADCSLEQAGVWPG